MYTNSEKIEEKSSVQRPSYDKTRLRFFLGQSTKKTIERNEPSTSEVKKDLNKIDDVSKDKENRKESHTWCDELGIHWRWVQR